MSHPMWAASLLPGICEEGARRRLPYRVCEIPEQYSEGSSMVSAKFCADVLTVAIDAFVWGGTETSAQL